MKRDRQILPILSLKSGRDNPTSWGEALERTRLADRRGARLILVAEKTAVKNYLRRSIDLSRTTGRPRSATQCPGRVAEFARPQPLSMRDFTVG